MNLSYVILMLWVFLMGIQQFGLAAVDGRLLGLVAFATVIVFLFESIGVVSWRIPGRRDV